MDIMVFAIGEMYEVHLDSPRDPQFGFCWTKASVDQTDLVMTVERKKLAAMERSRMIIRTDSTEDDLRENHGNVDLDNTTYLLFEIS